MPFIHAANFYLLIITCHYPGVVIPNGNAVKNNMDPP